MRLIVTALYREDLANRFVLGLVYSEWLTFEDHQLTWVATAMVEFFHRWYADCRLVYTNREIKTRAGIVVDMLPLPRLFAKMPDGNLVNLFHVEVEI